MNTSLSLEISKKIWSGESGYKRINNFFCKKKGDNKSTYPLGTFIKEDDKNKMDYYDDSGNKTVYDVENVIKMLKSGMETSKTIQTYYRGEGVKSKNKYKKEGFISLSQEICDAISFMENKCCLFEVSLDADVKRLNTGVEKEILIEEGCYWEYTGESKKKVSEGEEYDVFIVKIHSPTNEKYITYPLFAECLITKPQHQPPPPQPMQEMTDEEWEELNSDGGGKKKTIKKRHKKRKTIKKRIQHRKSRKINLINNWFK